VNFVFAPVVVKKYLMWEASRAARLLAHNAAQEWPVKPDNNRFVLRSKSGFSITTAKENYLKVIFDWLVMVSKPILRE
jgi:hypothetical protein